MRRIPRTVWLLLAVAAVIIIPFMIFEDAINAWFAQTVESGKNNQWLLAAMFFGLLAGDIFLPVPSSIVSTFCGLYLGVSLGFWTSFAGMGVSCAVGYLTGRLAAARAEKLIGAQELAALQRFHARWGTGLLIALRPVPVLAEASVLFAGLSRMPVRPCALWLLIGNAAVSLAYALAGGWGHDSGAMYPALGASLLFSGLAMLGAKLWEKKHPAPGREPVPAEEAENNYSQKDADSL